MSDWPDAPNLHRTVVSALPVTCSVLIAFAGAFFVAITLAEADLVKDEYVFLPLIVPGSCEIAVPVDRCTAISVVAIASIISMLASIIASLNAQMLEYHESDFAQGLTPPDEIANNWRKRRIRATAIAMFTFNLGLPLWALGLLLLLDKSMLSIGIYFVVVWLGLVIFHAYKEVRSNPYEAAVRQQALKSPTDQD